MRMAAELLRPYGDSTRVSSCAPGRCRPWSNGIMTCRPGRSWQPKREPCGKLSVAPTATGQREARAMWSAAQHEFATAVLDAGRSPPVALTSQGDGTPAKRFAVYRNNVVVGLVGALRARFPVVERIIGAECF